MRGSVVTALLLVACLPAAAASPASAGDRARHSGLVSTVDPATRTVVLEELAEEGKPRQLEVKVAAQARLLLAERTVDALAPDRLGPFIDRPLDLADVQRGDFVTVEGTVAGRELVADALTVAARAPRR
jgi:hypothetical protein